MIIWTDLMSATLIQPLRLADIAQEDGRIPYCRVVSCPDHLRSDDLLFLHLFAGSLKSMSR